MTPAAKKRLAQDFLRSFGRRALALYRRFSAGLPDRRCRTCAFREMERHGVDGWKGWDTSLMGMTFCAGAALPPGMKPKVFVCHQSKKAGGRYVPHQKLRFCAGYAVLAGRPEFARAVCEAAIDAEAGS